MRNTGGRSEPRVTLLISNFMRRFDTKTRLWNGFSAMHGGYSAPLWVPLLGDIDSADVSGFYKRQLAACGSRYLTHLCAPGLRYSFFLFLFFLPRTRGILAAIRWKHLIEKCAHHFGCCLYVCVFLPVLSRGNRGFSICLKCVNLAEFGLPFSEEWGAISYFHALKKMLGCF